MKSHFILFIILNIIFLVSDICHGVPASPIIYELQQSDGTIFLGQKWGDEMFHGWQNLDGYKIKFDEESKNWVYSPFDEIQPSRTDGRYLRTTQVQVETPPDKASSPQGTRKIPVIMINFSDRSTSYNTSDFNTSLFGSGNKSMKDYYEEISYGKFTISSGSAGIKGWFTAPKTHDYYGTNSSGQDAHPAELVIDAVKAADASINFAEYDSDGDCYCDVVAIIHQGKGEEDGGTSTDIWSHNWNLQSAAISGDGTGVYTTNDSASCGNIKIKNYIIMPEKSGDGLQSTIGVFAHEYGHSLGLPDLYDTDNSSYGIGNWGLMGSGSWNNTSRQGDTPAHMCAWSKFFLGWISPTQVSGTLNNELIEPASQNEDVYKFLSGTSSSGEYILVENRYKSGFDSGLPRSGLVIWHIDANKSNNDKECYPPNDCSSTHYKVSIEQADGSWNLEKKNNKGDSGDVYPGTSNNTDYTNTSLPNSKLYSGSSSNIYIKDIKSESSNIRATLSLGEPATTSTTTSTSTTTTTTSTTSSTNSSSTTTSKSTTSVSSSSTSTSTSSSSSTTKETTTIHNNERPVKPDLYLPSNGAENVELQAKLETKAFSDPDNGDIHQKTEWIISTDKEFSVNIFNTISKSNLISLNVPQGVLDEKTIYYWKVRFYDNHDASSEWSDLFSFRTLQTNNDSDSDGIQDDQKVDNGTDLDENTIIDNQQADIKSINTIIGDTKLGVKISELVKTIENIKSIDPKNIEEKKNKPDQFPIGMINFKLKTENVGDVVKVNVYFADPLEKDLKWYHYDEINGWEDYSDYAAFSSDRKYVTLTLKDGGFGDSDGVANGVVVDPSGPAKSGSNDSSTTTTTTVTTTTTTITSSAQSSGGGGGGGGCFINTIKDFLP
ncbi:MAG: M6 family metalloprotease domain-containing protein [Desulfobacterales bacterium]|nr:M6 family metalloprotease domain-containing protein [Desulfobacterales bacterium]